MDLEAYYEIASTADFIHGKNFSRVALQVLYGLEYAHVISHIKEAVTEASTSCSGSQLQISFADVVCFVRNPCEHQSKDAPDGGFSGSENSGVVSCKRYLIGGLIWSIREGHKMEDYLLFWIGSDNSAFSNAVLTFNGCEIVRYDATKERLVTDVSQWSRIVKFRYCLVEKAKDANMVGILVGTLGVVVTSVVHSQRSTINSAFVVATGYLHMVDQMKELITRAGKKAYTLVMGRPSPAKLANFPELITYIWSIR